MIYRQNKPMPESPLILERVRRALPRGGGYFNVPWSEFVFSTRDGKTYMPPTLKKGIEMVSRTPRHFAGSKGVLVRVERAMGGTYDGDTFTIASAPNENTIRHETLHFVQSVGDNLIRVTKGDPTAFTPGGMESRMAVGVETQEGADRAFLSAKGFGLFGGPKRRHATKGKGMTKYTYQRDHAVHALHDMEFQTNIVSIAVTVEEHMKAYVPKPMWNPITLAIGARKESEVKTAKMTPERARAFRRGVFIRVANDLGLPATLIPPVKAALGETVVIPPKPERKPARERAQPPVRPVPPPAPPQVQRGTTYRAGKQDGRSAFLIFKDGQPTGKYFYTEDKAKAFCAKARA